MMKLWSSVLVLVVAVLVAVGSASAQEKKKRDKKGEGKRPTTEQIFKKLDADGDGFITVAEMLKSPRIKDEAAAKARIEKMDTDEPKDGKVSLKEFEKAMKKWQEGHKKGDHKKGDRKKGEKKEK